MKYPVLLIFVLAALGLHIVSVSGQGVWTLVWRDEFNGSGQPNSRKWAYHVGNGWNAGANNFIGWGNNELEWYRPQNCTRQNGKLVIKATYKPNAQPILGRTWPYRSCRITTDTKFSILYGAVEARIKMPNKAGTWPAFWMLGDACDDTVTTHYKPPASHYDVMNTNWASCGEIDIVEHRNNETSVVHNLFWDTRTGLFPWNEGTVASDDDWVTVGNVNKFHVYRLEWTPTQLQWFVDKNLVKTVNTTPANMEEFQKSFHLILNLALGGTFANASPNPADFPISMQVDYVRVYKRS